MGNALEKLFRAMYYNDFNNIIAPIKNQATKKVKRANYRVWLCQESNVRNHCIYVATRYDTV